MNLCVLLVVLHIECHIHLQQVTHAGGGEEQERPPNDLIVLFHVEATDRHFPADQFE